MTTTIGVRKLLDLKQWQMCAPAPSASVAGSCIISSRHHRNQQLLLLSSTVHYLYLPEEDAFVQLPSGALAGTFGAGTCGTAVAFGTGSTIAAASLTATGGTTSTIITNQTLARDLRGYCVHVLSGPNAGVTLDIESNTVGANATITVATQGAAFTSSTVYRIGAPRWYVLNAGTIAAGSFRVYDFATNTWTSLTTTGLPASIGTDARLVATPSFMDHDYVTFGTGTASAGGASTLTDGAKAWTASQWINSQVRIVSGTGAGQIRTISANTSTQLTVSSAWTTQPDATSVYAISGNDDFLYLMGNNAVTLYRYSISGNSWSTLSPGAARSGAPTTGMSGHWVWNADDAAWTGESAIINGRRIYSFRGAAGGVVDYYDIAANTWVSALSYAPAVETFTTGTKYVYNGNYLYIQKDATGRWFRFDFVRQMLDGWSVMVYPQGAALLGDTAFDVTYHDGATEIQYIYMLLNTSTIMLRSMVI